MVEALALIDRYQAWLYLFLGLAALGYAGRVWNAYQELQRSIFGLEREQALARLRRSAAFAALAAFSAAAIFVLTTYVTPSLPATLPTPMPTISLLTTPAAPVNPIDITPPASTGIDSSGCQNPQATITDPQPNASLSGIVVIRGTAAIESFAFFKLEYRGQTEEGPWRAILAREETVIDGELGSWDTSLILPGDYALRLVVVDTAGNAPLPCAIPVRIAPTP